MGKSPLTRLDTRAISSHGYSPDLAVTTRNLIEMIIIMVITYIPILSHRFRSSAVLAS